MSNPDLLAFISALGGMEAVKWLLNWLTRHKTEARKEEAAADSLENENQRRQVDWLEKRLAERDTRIDHLYAELQRERNDKQEWIDRCHKAELECKELEAKRCFIRGCEKRKPPSEY